MEHKNKEGESGRRSVRIAGVVMALLVFILLFFFFSELLIPKYMTNICEGAFIAEYYNETTDHDVIFLGDCEAYENISPLALWRDFGITSYVRGSPQQLIWQSYYLLLETLDTEKPKAVVYNVLPMIYGEPQSEEYNRLTLDGMRMSVIKLKAVKASMTKDEKMIEYILPVLRYHDRITEVSEEDIKYYFNRDELSYNGYYMRVDSKAPGIIPEPEPLADYTFSDKVMEYLDKMRLLCEEKGIEFILMKAPSLYPVWRDQWETQVEEYAEKYGLTYINCLELNDETGIDMNTDTYDGGLHLNVYGAEKLSHYLGGILAGNYGIADRRGEEKYSSVWDLKLERYEKDKKLKEETEKDKPKDPDHGDDEIPEEPEAREGFEFRYKELSMYMNQEAAYAVMKLGDPLQYFESPSCAFEGLDKIYYYKDFRLYTYPDGGKDRILSIVLSNDIIGTKEGIFLGDTKEKVMEVYGEDYTDKNGSLVYEKADSEITFIFEEGLLDSVQYYAKTDMKG